MSRQRPRRSRSLVDKVRGKFERGRRSNSLTGARRSPDEPVNVFASDMVSTNYILDRFRLIAKDKTKVRLEIEDLIVNGNRDVLLAQGVLALLASDDRQWVSVSFVDTVGGDQFGWWVHLKRRIMTELDTALSCIPNKPWNRELLTFQASLQIREGKSLLSFIRLLKCIRGQSGVFDVTFGGALYGYGESSIAIALAEAFEEGGELSETITINVKSGWKEMPSWSILLDACIRAGTQQLTADISGGAAFPTSGPKSLSSSCTDLVIDLPHEDRPKSSSRVKRTKVPTTSESAVNSARDAEAPSFSWEEKLREDGKMGSYGKAAYSWEEGSYYWEQNAQHMRRIESFKTPIKRKAKGTNASVSSEPWKRPAESSPLQRRHSASSLSVGVPLKPLPGMTHPPLRSVSTEFDGPLAPSTSGKRRAPKRCMSNDFGAFSERQWSARRGPRRSKSNDFGAFSERQWSARRGPRRSKSNDFQHPFVHTEVRESRFHEFRGKMSSDSQRQSLRKAWPSRESPGEIESTGSTIKRSRSSDFTIVDRANGSKLSGRRLKKKEKSVQRRKSAIYNFSVPDSNGSRLSSRRLKKEKSLPRSKSVILLKSGVHLESDSQPDFDWTSKQSAIDPTSKKETTGKIKSKVLITKTAPARLGEEKMAHNSHTIGKAPDFNWAQENPCKSAGQHRRPDHDWASNVSKLKKSRSSRGSGRGPAIANIQSERNPIDSSWASKRPRLIRSKSESSVVVDNSRVSYDWAASKRSSDAKGTKGASPDFNWLLVPSSSHEDKAAEPCESNPIEPSEISTCGDDRSGIPSCVLRDENFSATGKPLSAQDGTAMPRHLRRSLASKFSLSGL